MCTAITLQSGQKENYFGRTMDFSFGIEPEVYVVYQNYEWYNAIDGQVFSDRYGFLGIGQESEGILAFFDGVNEKGFAAAALYFAGCAEYGTRIGAGKEPVASVDFLHYILGKCASVDELGTLLQKVSLIGLQDPVTETVAPLHWIAADANGKCAVIEQTKRGLELFENPIGVLANSPGFQWHMTNLRNYLGVSPRQDREAVWGETRLTPFGQGGGTGMLPGGYTSPERFVRAAYQKTHVPATKSRRDAIVSCFHIMDGVTIPKGVVITDRNTCDYTKYTAFINTNTCEYFFKTYDNSRITTVSLWENYRYSAQPICLGKLARPAVFDRM